MAVEMVVVVVVVYCVYILKFILNVFVVELSVVGRNGVKGH